LNNLASSLGDDNPAQTAKIVVSALEVAQRLGLRGMVNWLTGTVAISRFALGQDWDGTVALLRTASDEAGNDSDRLRLMLLLEGLQAPRGEPTDVDLERELSSGKALDDVGMTGLVLQVQGERSLVGGKLEEAHRSFKRAVDVDPGDAQVLSEVVRSAIWIGDPQLIRDASSALLAAPFSGRSTVAAKRWASAALAALDGRRVEAMSELRAAAALMDELDMRFESARVRFDSLKLLPDEPDAVSMVEEAREAFGQIGAKAYVDLVDAALAGGSDVNGPRSSIDELPAPAVTIQQS
jgi:hypothetical protein